MTEPFDFVRYFKRVHQTPFYHAMHLGMVDYANLGPSLAILDIGCGPGRLVQHLFERGAEVVGADADERMVGVAKQLYAKRPFVTSLVEKLPFPSNHFDVVLAGNLLFFLPDPTAALQEMVRVAKQGGRVVVWNPSEQMSQTAAAQYVANHPDMTDFGKKHLLNWSGVAEANRRWSGDDLQQLFGAAGLVAFETITVLDGLARYGRGVKQI